MAEFDKLSEVVVMVIVLFPSGVMVPVLLLQPAMPRDSEALSTPIIVEKRRLDISEPH